MPVSGKLFIGARPVTSGQSIHVLSPAPGKMLEPAFSAAGLPGVGQACEPEWSAFQSGRE